VSVPKSTESAALLTDDKEANSDARDDQANRPENNADLGEIAREQQADTKHNHGVPALQCLQYPQVSNFMQDPSGKVA
jgi:hypothetical protein